ncbi:MAG TPA: ABC transporter ATP-binding protein [Hyphomicrobiales bacterium]|nr:ABC transporter ATP-binding protein [Hyphomicrobiales bacterium]
MPEAPILETRNLTKLFGGVAAVNGVSLQFAPAEVHALIGPNGAGKTTFLNVLSGELSPTSGKIYFKGKDVTRWGPDALAQAGLGRSFQHSSIMQNFTLFENVRLAAQAQSGISFGMFSPAERFTEVTEVARGAITAAGVGRADRLAAEASHGERRQLEIAMLLATNADVLLLDEPTSGMGRAETQELIALIKKLRGRHTILLVEHDMDAVFSLADRITVLVYGRVLATGTPAEVRRNPEVRAAYLGEGSLPVSAPAASTCLYSVS